MNEEAIRHCPQCEKTTLQAMKGNGKYECTECKHKCTGIRLH